MINIKAISEPDSLNFWIQSDLADGQIIGNINPEDIPKTLQTAFRKYIGLTDTNQLETGKHLAFLVNVNIPPDSISRLIPKLNSLNISKFEGIYHSDHNELLIELQLPEANYSNIQFDTLNLNISGKDENLLLDFNCSKISYDSLHIDRLGLKAR